MALRVPAWWDQNSIYPIARSKENQSDKLNCDVGLFWKDLNHLFVTLLKTTWNLLNGNLLKKTWNLLNFGNLLKTTWNLLNFGNLLKKTWNLLNFGNLLKTAWNRLVSHVVVVGRLIVHVSVLHLGDFYHFGICRIHTYHTAIDSQWIDTDQNIKDGKLPPSHRVSFGHQLHSTHLDSIVVSLFVFFYVFDKYFLCVWQIFFMCLTNSIRRAIRLVYTRHSPGSRPPSSRQRSCSSTSLGSVEPFLFLFLFLKDLHVNEAVAALLSDLWDLSTDADQYNQGQGQCGQYRDQDVDPRLHRCCKWKQQEQKIVEKGLFGRNEREHESYHLHLRVGVVVASVVVIRVVAGSGYGQVDSVMKW